MASLLPNYKAFNTNYMPSFNIDKFYLLPTTGVRSYVGGTSREAWEARRYHTPTNLAHFVLGDFWEGSREVQDILHKHDVRAMSQVPFLNRAAALGLTMHDRYYKPTFVDKKPWIAGINTAQSLAESLDILANPIKAMMPWTGGGSLDDVVNALGLDGDYIKTYQWNVKTGNGVLDFAVNLVGEIFSNPLVLANITKSAVQSSSKAIIEQEVAKTVKGVIKGVDEFTLNKHIKQLTRAMLRSTDELAMLSFKDGSAEITQAVLEKVAKDIAAEVGVGFKYLIEPLNAIKTTDAWQSYYKIAKTGYGIKSVEQGIKNAAQWITPIGPVKELYHAAKPLVWHTSNHINSLRSLVNPDAFQKDPIGALQMIEQVNKEHTQKMYAINISNWVRFFEASGVDMSYDELYAIYKDIAKNYKGTEKELLKEISAKFRNVLASKLKNVPNADAFIAENLDELISSIEPTAHMMLQLEEDSVNFIYNRIAKDIADADNLYGASGRSVYIEHIDYLDKKLIHEYAEGALNNGKTYSLKNYKSLVDDLYRHQKELSIDLQNSRAEHRQIQSLKNITLDKKIEALREIKIEQQVLRDKLYVVQQTRLLLNDTLKAYGVTFDNSFFIHELLEQGKFDQIKNIVDISSPGYKKLNEVHQKITSSLASTKAMKRSLKEVENTLPLFKELTTGVSDSVATAEELLDIRQAQYNALKKTIKKEYDSILERIDPSFLHIYDRATEELDYSTGFIRLVTKDTPNSVHAIDTKLEQIKRIVYRVESMLEKQNMTKPLSSTPALLSFNKDLLVAIDDMLINSEHMQSVLYENLKEDAYKIIVSRMGKGYVSTNYVLEQMSDTVIFKALLEDHQVNMPLFNNMIVSIAKTNPELARRMRVFVTGLRNNAAFIKLVNDSGMLFNDLPLDKKTLDFLTNVIADTVLSDTVRSFGNDLSTERINEVINIIMRQINSNQSKAIQETLKNASLVTPMLDTIEHRIRTVLVPYVNTLKNNGAYAEQFSAWGTTLANMNALSLAKSFRHDFVETMQILVQDPSADIRVINHYEAFMIELGLTPKEHSDMLRVAAIRDRLLDLDADINPMIQIKQDNFSNIMAEAWDRMLKMERNVEGLFVKTQTQMILGQINQITNIYDMSIRNGFWTTKKVLNLKDTIYQGLVFQDLDSQRKMALLLDKSIRHSAKKAIQRELFSETMLEQIRELLTRTYSNQSLGFIMVTNPVEYFKNLSVEDLLTMHYLSLRKDIYNTSLSNVYFKNYATIYNEWSEFGAPRAGLKDLAKKLDLADSQLEEIRRSEKILDSFDKVTKRGRYAEDAIYDELNDTYKYPWEKMRLDELRNEDLTIDLSDPVKLTTHQTEFGYYISKNKELSTSKDNFINNLQKKYWNRTYTEAVPEYGIKAGDSMNFVLDSNAGRFAKHEKSVAILENRLSRTAAEVRVELDNEPLPFFYFIMNDIEEAQQHPYMLMKDELQRFGVEVAIPESAPNTVVVYKNTLDTLKEVEIKPEPNLLNHGEYWEGTVQHGKWKHHFSDSPMARHWGGEGDVLWWGDQTGSYGMHIAEGTVDTYTIKADKAFNITQPTTWPAGFEYEEVLGENQDLRIQKIRMALDKYAKDKGFSTGTAYLKSLGYDAVILNHSEGPETIMLDLSKVFDSSGEPLEIAQKQVEDYSKKALTYKAHKTKLKQFENIHEMFDIKGMDTVIRTSSQVPRQLYNGEFLDLDMIDDLVRSKAFQEAGITEEWIQQVYVNSLKNIQRDGIIPNTIIMGSRPEAYNAVTDAVKLGSIEDATVTQALKLFGEDIVQSDAILKDYTYMSNDLVRSFDAMASRAIRKNNTTVRYCQMFFNNDYVIQEEMFKGMSDKEIATFFKRGAWTTAILREDSLGRPTVHRFHVWNRQTLNDAIKAKASMFPEAVYRNMHLTVNNHRVDSKLLGLWERTIMTTYKTLWLTTTGFLGRNFMDSAVMRNATELGSFWEAIKYDFQAAKAMYEYEDILRTIKFHNNDKLGFEAIKTFVSELDQEVQERFYLVDLFFKSQASGGLSKEMTEYLERFVYEKNSTLMYAWEKFYHENLLYNAWSPATWVKDLNSEVESIARLGMFFGLVDRGVDSASAIAKIVQTHFDYGLRNSSQNIIENLFWFSTFPMNNFLYWLNDSLEQAPHVLKAYLDAWQLSWNNDSINYEEVKKSRFLSHYALDGGLLLNVAGKDRLIKLGFSVFDFFEMVTDPVSFIKERLNPIASVPLGIDHPENLNPLITQVRHGQAFMKGQSLIPSVYRDLDDKSYKYRYTDIDFTRWRYPRRIRKSHIRKPRRTGYQGLRRSYIPRASRYRQGITFKALNQQYVYQTYDPSSSKNASWRDTRRTNVSRTARRVFKA